MPRIILLFVFLSLFGCVSNLLLPDESWRFIGKLSIKTKTESLILGIDWRHYPDKNFVLLTGPFGVKVASITTKGERFFVEFNDSITRDDENVLIATTGIAGLNLPWDRVTNWLRIDKTGVFSDGNWDIDIMEISAEGPLTMILEHPEIILKLKINRWEIY